jgi:hypothetical protein
MMMIWKGFGRKQLWPNFKVLSWNSPTETEEIQYRFLNLPNVRMPNAELRRKVPKLASGKFKVCKDVLMALIAHMHVPAETR